MRITWNHHEHFVHHIIFVHHKMNISEKIGTCLDSSCMVYKLTFDKIYIMHSFAAYVKNTIIV